MTIAIPEVAKSGGSRTCGKFSVDWASEQTGRKIILSKTKKAVLNEDIMSQVNSEAQ